QMDKERTATIKKAIECLDATKVVKDICRVISGHLADAITLAITEETPTRPVIRPWNFRNKDNYASPKIYDLAVQILDTMNAWAITLARTETMRDLSTGSISNLLDQVISSTCAKIRAKAVMEYNIDDFAYKDTEAIDVIWQEYKAFVTAIYCAIPLLGAWNNQGAKTYVISQSLMEMFKHTNLDRLPTSLLCVPYGCCYLRCPDLQLGDVMLDGLLLYQEKDSIHVSMISGPDNFFWSMAMIDAKYDRLKDAFKDKWAPPPEIQHIVACALIYIISENADIILAKDSPKYREWIEGMKRRQLTGKDRTRIKKHPASIDEEKTYNLGEYIVINRHRPPAVIIAGQEKGSHRSPVPHWREGHFRQQAIGPRSENKRKTVWIEPTIVNAFEGMEIPKKKKYKLV
ncbi:MAG: hypothetical protein JW704_13210, partial [Anaerolineaceae bacterium]|nr:hypothetical protein [Anaerolineaceae bacterium]